MYHLTFGPHESAMTIEDGDEIQVQIPDCDGLGPDGKQLDSCRFETGDGSINIANPVAGPYVINSAEIGDSVTINIKNIEINSKSGRTGISARQITIPPKMFVTPDDPENNQIVPEKEFSWKIDLKNNLAVFQCKNITEKKHIKVDLHPAVGCIGVAPENSQFLDGLSSGNFGGNIDIPDLGIGASITLPVFLKGAYIFLGDLHAAQGDGEIIGGAIEVSGTVTFQVNVNKNDTIHWPRIETPDQAGIIASGRTIDEAIKIAYSQLTLWITKEYNIDRWDALNLISQTGRARPGNSKTAICTIDKESLKGIQDG